MTRFGRLAEPRPRPTYWVCPLDLFLPGNAEQPFHPMVFEHEVDRSSQSVSLPRYSPVPSPPRGATAAPVLSPPQASDFSTPPAAGWLAWGTDHPLPFRSFPLSCLPPKRPLQLNPPPPGAPIARAHWSGRYANSPSATFPTPPLLSPPLSPRPPA